MNAVTDPNRMIRKQYYLSPSHVARLEAIRKQTGVESDAEVIRLAIEAFDPEAPSNANAEQAAELAEAMLEQIKALEVRIDETLEKMSAERDHVNDPAWEKSIRERTRAEAAQKPSLVAGAAALLGARSA
jgi:hypothetical protein